jgi:hypothetical protein
LKNVASHGTSGHFGDGDRTSEISKLKINSWIIVSEIIKIRAEAEEEIVIKRNICILSFATYRYLRSVTEIQKGLPTIPV